MTEKQIIINVNKCKYRDTYTNFCKAEKDDIGECHTICTGNDCYYKQLKRKEQECEKLKKQVCGLRPELKGLINDACCKYNIEVKTYHKKIVEIIHHLNMYDQTLTEIKEIAEKAKKNICNNCDWRNTDSCDPEDYTCGEFIKILQKSARL